MKPIFEIQELQHGNHVCLLYRSLTEQKNVLVSLLKEGIDRSELCLYIVDEQLEPELAKRLAADGIDLVRLQQEGTLQILNRYQTFLRYARFDPVLMRELFERLLEQTLAKKFTGLRVIADMTWALVTGCDQLIAFEAMLNNHIPRWKMTQVCQYNLERFAPPIILDVLRTHPVALLGEHICPNFYSEPSEF
ncbi:MAG: hypothetical protein C4294_13460, partial [Nitrospiraceae bacterium]